MFPLAKHVVCAKAAAALKRAPAVAAGFTRVRPRGRRAFLVHAVS